MFGVVERKLSGIVRHLITQGVTQSHTLSSGKFAALSPEIGSTTLSRATNTNTDTLSRAAVCTPWIVHV